MSQGILKKITGFLLPFLLLFFLVPGLILADVSVLHTFDSTSSGPYYPYGGLEFDGTYFYGTTSAGGSGSSGVIFKIMPDGSNYSVIQTFTIGAGGRGRYGYDNPILSGGFLYGTTNAGGASGVGLVYKVDPSDGTYTILHAFNGTDGANPGSELLLSGGVLYGVTQNGGTNNLGTIFKINTDGSGFSTNMPGCSAV